MFCTLDHSKDDNYRLFFDHEIVCWEGSHLFYTATVGIFGIIIWLIAFPLVIFLTLKGHEVEYNAN